MAPIAGPRALQAAEPQDFVDRIAAVVNSDVITVKDLRDRVDVMRQLQRQGTQLPPRDAIERQILERLILERAQVQMARGTGYPGR